MNIYSKGGLGVDGGLALSFLLQVYNTQDSGNDYMNLLSQHPQWLRLSKLVLCTGICGKRTLKSEIPLHE